ncbi:hypothetical protein ACFFHH_22285 [Cytobacillus solani]|uniref:Uncharacterized protein n=1 Tax=Cytobacillus solani TaxID=1637975 RepID=A0A0Q3QNN5_9BACI|nr:hypothetical protein [Cytobacillus solani]KOP82324.1 hypothetical protein AMS60_07380 [Bacillus sp. FJAT-21945]KQL19334.1 hypothetical protein AN957_12650 [Cytobacillus solani]USK57244.1 hypothetical protein LIS82_12580 [Cytobacillus solani]
MNNWLAALFNTMRKQNIMKMFGRKRNNKGIVWASLLGLGVSAVAYGLKRNQNSNMLRPIQKVMNSIQLGANGNKQNAPALAEIAKELGPDLKSLTNK